MRKIGRGLSLPLAVVALAVCFGCTRSTTPPDAAINGPALHDDHDHEGGGHDHAEHADDDHPTTYAEAVVKVEALDAEMREALEKGEKDKADDALHEIGHVLEHVDELAEKASLSEAQRDDVKKDVEELLDHFSAIDEKIHGDEQVAHDELSEKIHAAIERLHGHAGP